MSLRDIRLGAKCGIATAKHGAGAYERYFLTLPNNPPHREYSFPIVLLWLLFHLLNSPITRVYSQKSCF